MPGGGLDKLKASAGSAGSANSVSGIYELIEEFKKLSISMCHRM